MPPKAVPGKWKVPPAVKAYEALGALADGRLRVIAMHLLPAGSSTWSAVDNVDSLGVARSKLRQFAVTSGAGAQVQLFASCQSSSLDKAYAVSFCATLGPAAPAHESAFGESACHVTQIAAVALDVSMNVNDNGAMFQGYLGYPAIALALALGLGDDDGAASIRDGTVPLLAGIPWKAIAKKHKNNWDVVVQEALSGHVLPKHGQSAVDRVKTDAVKVSNWIDSRAVDKCRRGGPLAPAKGRVVEAHVKRSRSPGA